MSKDSRRDTDKDRHTPILEHGCDTLQRIEIITGTGRRRRWSTDAKAVIVAESFAPGASVSAVARRHDIRPSLLFLWRRQVTRAQLAERGDRGMPAGFVPVAIHRLRRQIAVVRGAGGNRVEVGAVRIRVRGTVDRRALCEVLAAVGTVGDDRAATRVVDLDRDAAGRFPSGDGLAAMLVSEAFGADPFDGGLYVFSAPSAEIA